MQTCQYHLCVIFILQLQLAVLIFPTQREDRYSAVKRIACADMSLPTQCIVSRTINQDKRLRAVTQKIALQINCKLGGELWALKIPLNGLMVRNCDEHIYIVRCLCFIQAHILRDKCLEIKNTLLRGTL